MSRDSAEIPPEVADLFARARRNEGSAPRKHHLVPASYLRRWAEPKHLRVTDRTTRYSFPASPDKAARETDFYRLESPDLDPVLIPPLAFETLLSDVEGHATRVIDVLVDYGRGLVSGTNPVISNEDAAWFTWYLAFQVTRGQKYRQSSSWALNEYFKLRYSEMSDEGIRSMLLEAGIERGPAELAIVKDFINGLASGRYGVAAQDAALTAESGETAKDIGYTFLSRTWFVYRAPEADLITCDEPVVALGGPEADRRERAGMGTAGAVVFPLDPSNLLVMFHQDEAVGTDGLIPDLIPLEVAQINAEIGANANRWLFERLKRNLTSHMALPPAPPVTVREGPLPRVERAGSELHRLYQPSSWYRCAEPPPWPLGRWWTRTNPTPIVDRDWERAICGANRGVEMKSSSEPLDCVVTQG